jgi:hypothetical protein
MSTRFERCYSADREHRSCRRQGCGHYMESYWGQVRCQRVPKKCHSADRRTAKVPPTGLRPYTRRYLTCPVTCPQTSPNTRRYLTCPQTLSPNTGRLSDASQGRSPNDLCPKPAPRTLPTDLYPRASHGLAIQRRSLVGKRSGGMDGT